MKKSKIIKLIACAVLAFAMLALAGCGGGQAADPGIEDGTYVATFTTDNSMFHVNEANQDKGILTVEDGKMTIHVSLQSKKIVNLYPGLAEDAQKDGAELLEPTTDTVTYSDGYTDEVYGFDVPVPALDEEFDLALLGTKGTWYDHKVVVSDPVPGDDIQAVIGGEKEASGDAETSDNGEETAAPDIAEGEHTVDVALEGGTGKASVTSPATIKVSGDSVTAVIEWSSPHYDYMIVEGEKYLPVNEDGNSVFEIPVLSFDKPMTVIADTTAMSEPHEIEYTLTFDSASVK
jgi:major membrane immunogen (membrane-anchored lipoprotein)